MTIADISNTTALIEVDNMVHTQEMVTTRSKGCIAACVALLKSDILMVTTLLAVAIGVGAGFLLREADISDDALMWIGLPGEVFLRCLKATVVPLVICLVITSTATLDPRKNGKIAVIGFITVVLSHLFASLIAVSLFFVFKPDRQEVSDVVISQLDTTALETQDVFADLIRNIFPDNIVSATFKQTSTQYQDSSTTSTIRNDSDPNNYTTVTSVVTKKNRGDVGGTNILGLIVWCSLIGMASNKILPPGSEFLKFFEQAQKVIFVIISWIFWLTPVGVASLIAVSLGKVKDIADVFQRLGLLIGAVSSGLAIHVFVTWGLALVIIARVNPFAVFYRCAKPYVIAFASTATSVALPDMRKSCERCGVSDAVSSFLLPMTVTIQADGSSVYIASCVLFLAQTSGGAALGDVIVTLAMTTVLSCAIPPVPSSSIVVIVLILTSLDVPLNDVALLFAVEWLLDRLRSGVNALTHVTTCMVTDKFFHTTRSRQSSEDEVEKQTEDDSTHL